LVGLFAASNCKNFGVGETTGVNSSDFVLNGPLVGENLVGEGEVSISGDNHTVDGLGGPEVDTSPSEIPEDLVRGTTFSGAIPLQLKRSDLSRSEIS